MTNPCPAQTSSGMPCAYPAETCPLHPRQLQPEAPPISERPVPTDPRAIGHAVAQQVADGSASPLQASRLIRSLSLLKTMGNLNTEEEEQAILAEVELRGVVMNGFPPRNEEEWLLARRVFDDAAIEEFTRWERCGSGWGDPDKSWVPPIPEHMLPGSLRGPQPAPGAILKLSPFLGRRQREYYFANGWEPDDLEPG